MKGNRVTETRLKLTIRPGRPTSPFAISPALEINTTLTTEEPGTSGTSSRYQRLKNSPNSSSYVLSKSLFLTSMEYVLKSGNS